MQLSIYQIIFLFILVVGIVFSLLIILKSVQNYKKTENPKRNVVIKSIIAFVAWIASSLGVIIANSIFAIGRSHTIGASPSDTMDRSIIYLGIFQILWIILGIVLTCFVSYKSKSSSIK